MCLIKLLPVLGIPVWLWVWIAGIALIKIINLISGAVKIKWIIALHTLMNKITGALCFLLPLTLSFIELKYSSIIVCTVATFAAIQEGYFIKTGRVKENVLGLFLSKKAAGLISSDISLQSTPGSGTEFCVILPCEKIIQTLS